MAKWSFLLLVFSLGVALAAVPSTRRIYADPRSLLALASAALPVLPYAPWLAQHDTGLIAGRSVLPKAALTAKRVVEGASSFLTGLVLVFVRWILVVAVFLRRCPVISPPEDRTETATRLAKELTRRGLGQAQFLTHLQRDAGNLEISICPTPARSP